MLRSRPSKWEVPTNLQDLRYKFFQWYFITKALFVNLLIDKTPPFVAPSYPWTLLLLLFDKLTFIISEDVST